MVTRNANAPGIAFAISSAFSQIIDSSKSIRTVSAANSIHEAAKS